MKLIDNHTCIYSYIYKNTEYLLILLMTNAHIIQNTHIKQVNEFII